MIKLAFDLPWNNELKCYKDSASALYTSIMNDDCNDSDITSIIQENINALLSHLHGDFIHNQNPIVNKKLSEKLLQLNAISQIVAITYPYSAKLNSSAADDYDENVISTVKIMRACKRIDGLVKSLTEIMSLENSGYDSDSVLAKTVSYASYYIKTVCFYK